jgi:hypothetical protein
MRRLTQWALVWALVCLAWWALAEGEVPNWPFVLPASALVSALVMALVAGQMIRLRWRVRYSLRANSYAILCHYL